MLSIKMLYWIALCKRTSVRPAYTKCLLSVLQHGLHTIGHTLDPGAHHVPNTSGIYPESPHKEIRAVFGS